ncbi:MAG: hypothetical protein KAI73_02200 [Rhodospirillaceae bacterium]|nr:hypothetical protein [Rhodospirillaceae bacterium]
MASHAEIAANLLRNAAIFFRDIGTQNEQLKEQMEVNARTYDAVAELVQADPTGEMDVPEGATAILREGSDSGSEG